MVADNPNCLPPGERQRRNLNRATNEAILRELKRRFSAMVFAGSTLDDGSKTLLACSHGDKDAMNSLIEITKRNGA